MTTNKQPEPVYSPALNEYRRRNLNDAPNKVFTERCGHEVYTIEQVGRILSEDARNAARYLFLRHADLDAMAAKYWPNGADVPEGEAFDAAVDAAMAARDK